MWQIALCAVICMLNTMAGARHVHAQHDGWCRHVYAQHDGWCRHILSTMAGAKPTEVDENMAGLEQLNFSVKCAVTNSVMPRGDECLHMQHYQRKWPLLAMGKNFIQMHQRCDYFHSWKNDYSGSYREIWLTKKWLFRQMSWSLTFGKKTIYPEMLNV